MEIQHKVYRTYPINAGNEWEDQGDLSPPKPELQRSQRSQGSGNYPHFSSIVGGNIPVQLLQESFGDAEAAQNLSIALSGLSCSRRRFPMTLSCFIHK